MRLIAILALALALVLLAMPAAAQTQGKDSLNTGEEIKAIS